MCSLAALDREAPAHEAVTDGEGSRWKHAELQRPLQTESGTAALGNSLFPMACAAPTAAPEAVRALDCQPVSLGCSLMVLD